MMNSLSEVYGPDHPARAYITTVVQYNNTVFRRHNGQSTVMQNAGPAVSEQTQGTRY